MTVSDATTPATITKSRLSCAPGIGVQLVAACGPANPLTGRGSEWIGRSSALAVALSVAVALSLLGGVAPAGAAGATGDLTQKPGLAGCISETGAGPCADGAALNEAASVAVSPDGRSAYVASNASDAVAVFDRGPDGELSQKEGAAGCISETGIGSCTDGRALEGALSVAVSPDGQSVYVASLGGDAVAVFDRAADGTLSQNADAAGCISDDGSGGECADGRALDGAISVTISPDDGSVYIASFNSDAVAVFDRGSDGSLSQQEDAAACVSQTTGGCLFAPGLDGASSVTVSPDGRNVYVASDRSDAVAVLNRGSSGTLSSRVGPTACVSESGGTPCADGEALDGPRSVTVSPDGRSAYVASLSSDAVAAFDRAANGRLSQKAGAAGCVSETGAGICADGTALDNPVAVTLSPDGRSAYAASALSGAVAVFDRAADGTLSQKPGLAGCIAQAGTAPCAGGVALASPRSVVVSPDGQSAYVASFSSNAVAIFDREPPLPVDPPVVPPAPPLDPLPLGGGDTEVKDPDVSAKKTQGIKKKVKVKIRAGAGEPVELVGKGKVTVKKGKQGGKSNRGEGRSFQLKTVRKSTDAGERTVLRLKPRKNKDGRKILKLLSKGTDLRANPSVKLTDEARNSVTEKRVVRLKLKKGRRG